jgi:hypothetical protein
MPFMTQPHVTVKRSRTTFKFTPFKCKRPLTFGYILPPHYLRKDAGDDDDPQNVKDMQPGAVVRIDYGHIAGIYRCTYRSKSGEFMYLKDHRNRPHVINVSVPVYKVRYHQWA